MLKELYDWSTFLFSNVGSLCYVVLIEMDMDLIHSTICLHVSNLKWKHYPLYSL